MRTRAGTISIAGLLLGTLASGCASRRDTGAALIGTGVVVAVVASQAATERHVVTTGTYSGSTSRHGAAAAAGVGAGVALAAAGAAIARGAPDDDAPRARTTGTSAGQQWRLVRPAESGTSSTDSEE